MNTEHLGLVAWGTGREQSVVVTLNAEWKRTAKAAMMELVGVGVPFTAEDHRRLAPDVDGVSPNACGAIFQWAVRKGYIVDVGQTRTRRQQGHGHRLTVWISTDTFSTITASDALCATDEGAA